MASTESEYFKVEAAEDTTEFIKIYPKDFSSIPLVKNWGNISFYRRTDMFPLEILDRVHNFEVYDDDVWIITNPKCGTTWTQEMCWLLLHELNFEEAKKIDLEERSPFLEFNLANIEVWTKMPRPRLIKTHQPMQLLPKDIWVKNPKMIYVIRDPRDAFVSIFHHMKFLRGKKAVDNMIDDSIEKSMKFRGFYENALDYYQLRGRKNFLFFSFEQMKKNLKDVIEKVCDFLGKSYSDEDIGKLVEHLDFKNMKNNESCSHRKELDYMRKKINLKEEDIDQSLNFMRKGQVGSYKNELPEELIRKIDEWERSYLGKDNLVLNDILYSK